MSKPIEEMSNREVAQELSTYTALCSDEWQEALDCLISAERYTYVFSDDFGVNLAKELRTNLMYCRENAKIVSETVTETVTHTETYLEWADD